MSTIEPDFPEPGDSRPEVDWERVGASREMGRALRAIQSVRMLYIGLVVVYGPIALFTALGGGKVLPGGTPAAVAIAVVLAGVPALGAWRIGMEPLLWTMVIAVLWSANVLIGLFVPPYFEVWDIIGVIIAGGCWAAVRVIRPAKELMVKYPDLRIARKLRGERGARARGGSSSRGGRRRVRR